MKSKTLGNVLIKVLGLSIFLYAIPSCVAALVFLKSHPSNTPFDTLNLSGYSIRPWVQLVVGFLTIAMSQTIAGWMFKNDDIGSGDSSGPTIPPSQDTTQI